MAQQWSDAQRIALSNAVIENIDLESAKEQVKRINDELRVTNDESRKFVTQQYLLIVNYKLLIEKNYHYINPYHCLFGHYLRSLHLSDADRNRRGL